VTLIHLIWLLGHAVAIYGLGTMIIQSLYDVGLASPDIYAPLQKWTGAFLAAASIILVSVSIYFERDWRPPPSSFSRTRTAPLFIFVGIIYLAVFLFSKGSISSSYADGLSAIALGGSLIRLTGVPYGYENRSDI